MENGNELIADYMGHKVPEEKDSYSTAEIIARVLSFPRYDTSIEWLYPVYIKLRKELKDFIYQNIAFKTQEGMFTWKKCDAIKFIIEQALVSGDITELHKEIIKGITFLNENKK